MKIKGRGLSFSWANCHKHLSKAEQLQQFFTKFLEQLEYLATLMFQFIFYRLDLFKYGINNNANDYLDMLLAQGYLQFITKSTQINGESNTLIDHIFSSDNLQNITSGVLMLFLVTS